MATPVVPPLDATAFPEDRHTTADEVFAVLHDDIVTLRLRPGDKLSEVDVAERLEVSRQPVREAFIRLDSLGFLEIRPRKATIVRHFSLTRIRQARFIRCAIEAEVVLEVRGEGLAAIERQLRQNLERQRRALDAGRTLRFHELDQHFHRLLCRGAGRESIVDTIRAQRIESDRLCLLSLGEPTEREQLYADHVRIVDHLLEGNSRKAVDDMRTHLGRLDPLIAAVHERHREYFTDESL